MQSGPYRGDSFPLSLMEIHFQQKRERNFILTCCHKPVFCFSHLKLFLVLSFYLNGCGREELTTPDDAEVVESAVGDASRFEPELGKGVDAAETRTFATCIHFPKPNKGPGTFRSRAYDEFSISSRADLNRKLGISAKVAAKGLWGSASAQTAYHRQIEIKESSFYWVVRAKYELAHESIPTQTPSFALSAQAKALLHHHGWAAFQAACGTHFYSGRSLGAEYSLLYEFSDRSDKVTENIAAKAQGGMFGIAASGDFSSALATAKSNHSLQIHSDIIGGDYRVADFAESPERLREELAAMRRAVGRDRRGVPLRWEMLSYDIFSEVVAARRDNDENEMSAIAVDDALEFFYNRFTENQEKNSQLAKILRESKEEDPLWVFSQEQLSKIESMQALLVGQNIEIAARARSCIAGPTAESCSFSDMELIETSIPDPIRDFSGLGDDDVFLIPTDDLHKQASPFLNILILSERPAFYATDCRIFQGPDSLVYAFAGKDRVYQAIGEMHIKEQKNGARQPTLCQGLYAKRCKFRSIERPGLGPDGKPNRDLMLSIFDDQGIILAKNVFHLTQA